MQQNVLSDSSKIISYPIKCSKSLNGLNFKLLNFLQTNIPDGYSPSLYLEPILICKIYFMFYIFCMCQAIK